jgi:glycosyltransferase involved in cell wall biosynthesis
MGGLAKRGWPVIWTNGPMRFWERGSSRWQSAKWSGRLKPEPVHGVTVDYPGIGSAIWQRVTGRRNSGFDRHARRLRDAVENQGRDLIAYVCWPEFLPYLDLLKPDFTVLHINDHWPSLPGWTSELQTQYLQLADRADLITAIAESMVRDLAPKHLAKTKILNHAVYAQDYIDGPSGPCPDDLASIPHPRIGYAGRVSRKVDLELVHEISNERPDWHWVFVGEVGIGFSGAPDMVEILNKCRKRPNIHFLGPRDQDLMPAYMGHMDVNTMCYKLEGGFWEAGNPLKQLEYLAVGKPVIGVGLENVVQYSNVIGIAGSTDEWVGQIERAIKEGGVGTVAERQSIARANTWEVRVNDLENWLLGYCR